MVLCFKNALYSAGNRTDNACFLWVLFFSKTTCPSLSFDILAEKEAVYALSSAELT